MKVHKLTLKILLCSSPCIADLGKAVIINSLPRSAAWVLYSQTSLVILVHCSDLQKDQGKECTSAGVLAQNEHA